MISIQSSTMTVMVNENGSGLKVVDKKRGTEWHLDKKSLVYGSVKQNVRSDPQGENLPLLPISARQVDPGEIVIVYQAGDVQVTYRFLSRNDYLEIRLVSVTAEIGYISLPGSFLALDESVKLLLPIMQGMLWDGRGPELNAMRAEGSHLGFSMALSGFLAESGGLLVTAETRDDLRWWFGKDSQGRMWITSVQLSSLGTLRYERIARIYVTEPDITSMAKQYRRKVIQQGNFTTWEEKIAERPGLERIFGALMTFIGYCEDDVDYVEGCRKLKAYGFDRALLYPSRFNIYYPDIRMGGVPAINLTSKTVEAIKSLGYDVAPWSWLNEALDTGSEIHPIFRCDQHGLIIPHWAIDDQQWYQVCHSFVEDFQQHALQTRLCDQTWDHFDVLACVPPMECFTLDHANHLGRPLSRSEDREWIRRVFRADLAAGRMVSSENFNDAYATELDFGSVKAWPQYGPWPFWPVPLTMLVYHDSMIHSWWEIHNYNNPWRGRTSMLDNLFAYGGGRPRLMAAMDALMGCPPDVFPFGAQYGYTGHGKETFLYKFRFEDPEVQLALKAALPVARLHRRIGQQEMVHFKILSEDGYIQESAFADGTHIVANFSLDFVGSIPGIDHKILHGIEPVEPEGWREMK